MISLAMFKIAPNTLRYFTLAEVFLMAAINQRQAKPGDTGHAGLVQKDHEERR
jgi:hypothetical protein